MRKVFLRQERLSISKTNHTHSPSLTLSGIELGPPAILSLFSGLFNFRPSRQSIISPLLQMSVCMKSSVKNKKCKKQRRIKGRMCDRRVQRCCPRVTIKGARTTNKVEVLSFRRRWEGKSFHLSSPSRRTFTSCHHHLSFSFPLLWLFSYVSLSESSLPPLTDHFCLLTVSHISFFLA